MIFLDKKLGFPWVLIQVYDVRGDFPFSNVKMSYLRSNIPCRIIYSTYGSEILRTERATSS